MLERGGEMAALRYCEWECKLMQPLWETARKFLKGLKTELPCDPAIPLLGIYLNKTTSKSYVCPCVHSSTIYNSQDTVTT